MNWLRNLSLKYKLIFLLVLLTGSMLTIYGFLALRDFEKDKIAYVLDANRAHSQAAALQIHTEIDYIADRAKSLMAGYVVTSQKFNEQSIAQIKKAENFEACLVWKYDNASASYKPVAQLSAGLLDEKFQEQLKIESEQSIPAALENQLSIRLSKKSEHWVLGLKFQVPGDRPLILTALLKSASFLTFFQVPQLYDTYLADSSGQALISPVVNTYPISLGEVTLLLQKAFEIIKAPEGVSEIQDGQRQGWMISKASIGIGQMTVISMVPRQAALEAVRLLIVKSILFLVFLIFVTIFISILSSLYLTKSLSELLNATKDISKGNFDIKVSAKGKDEIGTLAKGFHKMTEEIQRLLKETAEKTRMEGELKTAQVVQSTLFPKQDLIEKDFEIRGFNQSASECCGDWWYYQKIKEKTIFCIGDATGHGVPAALLTAAARSSVSILETFPDISIAEMMTIFNRAIFNTANGNFMMTFFLGSYDHQTGILTYINASHEPPILFPKKDELKRDDFVFLDAEINPSLGRNPNSQFKLANLQLNPGDRLMLYTDGMTEVQDSSGKTWGERALLKCLLRCANEKKDLPMMVREIANEITNFRKEKGLIDDVTYFFVGR